MITGYRLERSIPIRVRKCKIKYRWDGVKNGNIYYIYIYIYIYIYTYSFGYFGFGVANRDCRRT